MIVVRSPLRVSLFGGGCDIPEYFSKFGAVIISFTLDRSIYLTHNPRPTGNYRLSYSKVEELPSLSVCRHTLINATEHRYGFGPPCTLSVVADLPFGTGLGSSSALAVALIKLVTGEIEPSLLAKLAYELEREVSPVGIQDHLPASHGGFRAYQIDTTGDITHYPVPSHVKRLVEKHGLLLYTGERREANTILREMKRTPPLKGLARIHELARWAQGNLSTLNAITLGETLTATWNCKREINGVSTPELDRQFDAALEAGAWGGKLCGAGGGGCWFFLVPLNKRRKVKDALGLTEISFSIGSAITEVAV